MAPSASASLVCAGSAHLGDGLSRPPERRPWGGPLYSSGRPVSTPLPWHAVGPPPRTRDPSRGPAPLCRALFRGCPSPNGSAVRIVWRLSLLRRGRKVYILRAHTHTSTHPRVYELTPTCAEGACKLRVRLFICDPRGRERRRQLTGTRSPGLWRDANAGNGRLGGSATTPLAPALSVIYWSVFSGRGVSSRRVGP